MGRYLAVTLRADAELPLSRALSAPFSGTPFVPVALGAVAARKAGDHWFLAGFAVEDFVKRFPARMGRVATVHVGADAGAEREYLDGVASALRAGRAADAPGPFERRENAAGATFIEGAAMGTSALAALDAWSAGQRPDAAYLYGAFPLAVRDPGGLPWNRAFRCFAPGPGPRALPAPLLFIRAGVSPFHAGTLEVLVFSEAGVWLREGSAHPPVGPAEADENLLRLVQTVEAIARGAGGALRSVTLEVDGARFMAERPRLADAFSAVPGFTGAS